MCPRRREHTCYPKLIVAVLLTWLIVEEIMVCEFVRAGFVMVLFVSSGGWELGRLDYSFVALRNRKISPRNSHVEKLRVSFGSFCIFILTLPPFKQKERKMTNTVL